MTTAARDHELNFATVIRICVVLMLAAPGFVAATQATSETDRPLQNRDITSTVAANIGESVILAAVEHAPREQLDDSPDALETLRESGVPDSVISAVDSRVGMRTVAQAQETNGDEASQRQSPPRPSEIKLYFIEKPTQPFKAIGRVSAKKYRAFGLTRKRESIDKDLREKAAKLDADAVIDITEDFGSVSGVAIEFTLE